MINKTDSNTPAGKLYRKRNPDPVTGFYAHYRVSRNFKEWFLKLRGWHLVGFSLLKEPYNNHGNLKNLDDAWAVELAHLKKVFHLNKKENNK